MKVGTHKFMPERQGWPSPLLEASCFAAAQSQAGSVSTIGHRKQERSAASKVGLHPNRSFVTLNHPPAYRQTQARARGTSTVKPSERLEDLFVVFRIDADAVIGYR